MTLVTLSAALAGCGKTFPEPWDKLELPTSDLTSAFADSDQPAVTALYAPSVGLSDIVAKWERALSAKGYARFCELAHADGSMNRGYENTTAKKRYLFTGGLLGQAPELRLLEVPEKVANADVCPKE